MLCAKTWPLFKGQNDKDGVKIIIDEKKFQSDCQFGKSKLFIKSPQTVFGLEQAREQHIPVIVTVLQKVCSACVK